MRSLLYMLLFVVGYFVVMFFTASETLFECSGSYDKSKSETVELRVKLFETSPLTFSKSGTLTVKNRVFLVKKEGSIYALYDNGSYRGSLNDLLEIFIDFPDDIFEGKCRKI